MSSLAKRLQKEVKDWARDPEPDMGLKQEDENDYQKWRAHVVGPKDTPFAGGKFEMRIHV